ncbi:hypothetical protein Ahy_A07g035482 isoform E [Arachis hypogaea]|uniref:Uncharacterized protein n=1 Tax=Arachis hypogaea TaxID=3818 RepID=A0A445CE82_ARAHY|nr:hypothetical protein Ahy_A07g035482 isoform E [Arachis hypogaea]
MLRPPTFSLMRISRPRFPISASPKMHLWAKAMLALPSRVALDILILSISGGNN